MLMLRANNRPLCLHLVRIGIYIILTLLYSVAYRFGRQRQQTYHHSWQVLGRGKVYCCMGFVSHLCLCWAPLGCQQQPELGDLTVFLRKSVLLYRLHLPRESHPVQCLGDYSKHYTVLVTFLKNNAVCYLIISERKSLVILLATLPALPKMYCHIVTSCF